MGEGRLGDRACEAELVLSESLSGPACAPEDALDSPQGVCLLVTTMPDSNSLNRPAEAANMNGSGFPGSREASVSPEHKLEAPRQERSRCFWVKQVTRNPNVLG